MSKLILPLTMMFGGLSLIASGGLVLLKPEEKAPTELTLAAVAREGWPKAHWVSIEDGIPYWSESVESWRQERGGGDRTMDPVIHVPLVTQEVADRWAEQQMRGEPISYAECLLILALDRSEAVPLRSRNQRRVLDVAGRIEAGEEIPAVVRDAMRSGGVSGLDFARIGVLRKDRKPLGHAGAGTLASLGALLSLVGVSWILLQRRRPNEPAVRSSERREEAPATVPQESGVLALRS